jgi:solute carrier family 31 (copper transporter), member 1
VVLDHYLAVISYPAIKMDSSMSMSMSPTATMSGMAMGTSTDESMHGASMMGMDSMAMTFFYSSSTPLYSMSWTPTSIGQYAGTCIFLIVLATIFRGLLAVRIHFDTLLFAFRRHRDPDEPAVAYINVDTSMAGKGGCAVAANGVRPWRTDEAVLRSLLDVILAAVSYLL